MGHFDSTITGPFSPTAVTILGSRARTSEIAQPEDVCFWFKSNYGINLTRECYAGSTVCAPSRSVLTTGQRLGHTRVRGNA